MNVDELGIWGLLVKGTYDILGIYSHVIPQKRGRIYTKDRGTFGLYLPIPSENKNITSTIFRESS